MNNKIFGGILTLWGAAVIGRWLSSVQHGSLAYQAGQIGGAIFGVLLLAFGLYNLFKKPEGPDDQE